MRREARTEEKAVLGVEDLRGDVVEATADDVARVEVQLGAVVPLADCVRATQPTATELREERWTSSGEEAPYMTRRWPGRGSSCRGTTCSRRRANRTTCAAGANSQATRATVSLAGVRGSATEF